MELWVAILGTGAALHPYRLHSSVLVSYRGRKLLVDAGCGSIHSMARLGVNPAEVEDVIVTHGHSDHYCGLNHLAFLKTFTGSRKMRIYTTSHAKPLVEELVSSIHKPHELDYTVVSVGPGSIVDLGWARVELFAAQHSVEALSLEVIVGDRRILVSGDTYPTSEYRKRARNVDLAIHEATLPSVLTEEARRHGHSTVEQALNQVEEARNSVLYHLSMESEIEMRNNGVSIIGDASIIIL